MTLTNLELLEDYIRQVWAEGDPEAARRFMAPGYRRYISPRLEPLGPDRTRLIQKERFTGLLVGVFASSLDQHTLAGFHAMNAALKARAAAPLLNREHQDRLDAAVPI